MSILSEIYIVAAIIGMAIAITRWGEWRYHKGWDLGYDDGYKSCAKKFVKWMAEVPQEERLAAIKDVDISLL